MRFLFSVAMTLCMCVCASADDYKLKGHISYRGKVYVVIEETRYEKPKVENDYYTRMKSAYLRDRYGADLKPMRVAPRKIKRTHYIPVDKFRNPYDRKK